MSEQTMTLTIDRALACIDLNQVQYIISKAAERHAPVLRDMKRDVTLYLEASAPYRDDELAQVIPHAFEWAKGPRGRQNQSYVAVDADGREVRFEGSIEGGFVVQTADWRNRVSTSLFCQDGATGHVDPMSPLGRKLFKSLSHELCLLLPRNDVAGDEQSSESLSFDQRTKDQVGAFVCQYLRHQLIVHLEAIFRHKLQSTETMPAPAHGWLAKFRRPKAPPVRDPFARRRHEPLIATLIEGFQRIWQDEKRFGRNIPRTFAAPAESYIQLHMFHQGFTLANREDLAHAFKTTIDLWHAGYQATGRNLADNIILTPVMA